MEKNRIMIGYNSRYMEYMRDKIKVLNQNIVKKNRMILVLVVVLFFVIIISLFAIYSFYVRLNNEHMQVVDLEYKLEQQEFIIKNQWAQIEEQKKKIENYELELYELKERAEGIIIESVRKLTGDILDRVIDVVYLEACDQDKKGMQLVADVIFNRIKSDCFAGDTAAEILNSQKQFNVLSLLPVCSERRQTEGYKIAESVVHGKILYDVTLNDEILFFMDPAKSGDISRNWMSSRGLIMRYKNHEFYK